MRITVFGSGYVGLVTGACLADAGNQVVCVDVDYRNPGACAACVGFCLTVPLAGAAERDQIRAGTGRRGPLPLVHTLLHELRGAHEVFIDVGVDNPADGALLVTDDGSNSIWRVQYVGADKTGQIAQSVPRQPEQLARR